MGTHATFPRGRMRLRRSCRAGSLVLVALAVVAALGASPAGALLLYWEPCSKVPPLNNPEDPEIPCGLDGIPGGGGGGRDSSPRGDCPLPGAACGHWPVGRDLDKVSLEPPEWPSFSVPARPIGTNDLRDPDPVGDDPPVRDLDRVKKLAALRTPGQLFPSRVLVGIPPDGELDDRPPEDSFPAQGSGPDAATKPLGLLPAPQAGQSLEAVLAAAALLVVGALVPPAVASYNHLSRERVTRHAMRRKILDHIAGQPGATCGELARTLRVHYSTAEHHLRILRRFDLVLSSDRLPHRRYFPRDSRVPADGRPLIAALRRSKGQRLLDLADGRAAFRIGEAARQMGVSASTASYHMNRLLRWGLVERRGASYALSPRGREVLAFCRPTSREAPVGVEGVAAAPAAPSAA